VIDSFLLHLSSKLINKVWSSGGSVLLIFYVRTIFCSLILSKSRFF